MFSTVRGSVAHHHHHNHRGEDVETTTTVSDLPERPAVDENAHPVIATREALLGEGKFGKVYEAIDETGLPLAVKTSFAKVIRTSQNVTAFQREFGTMRDAGPHPNIVKPHSYGVGRDGREFIAMELMSKGSLQDAIDASVNNVEGTVFSEDEIRHALREVLTGLEHLHHLGFAHGDIKPANILLGDGGAVKISDFGSAGEEGDAVNTPLGTPRFMSREAIESIRLFANDMWAVGCCLGYLATGKKPWADIDRENNYALCYAIADALSRGATPFAPSDVERLSKPQQRLLEHLFNSDASRRPTAAKLLTDPYFAVADDVALESCGGFSDTGMPTSFPARDELEFEESGVRDRQSSSKRI